MSDPINKPAHYVDGRKYEPLDVILDWELGYCLGSVVKYISRAGRKWSAIEDLKKARFYLDREIADLATTTNYSTGVIATAHIRGCVLRPEHTGPCFDNESYHVTRAGAEQQRIDTEMSVRIAEQKRKRGGG